MSSRQFRLDPTQPQHNAPLLEARDVQVCYPRSRGLLWTTTRWRRVVEGVSLAIQPGQTLGLVGESGCGKTTVARAVLRLTPIAGGRILFDGMDISELEGAALRTLRRQMQMVFQDQYASLPPRTKVAGIVGEPLTVHRMAHGRDRIDMVAAVLERVGLGTRYLNRYVHELSGGERQRVNIARAVVLSPRFLVCDEPLSAQDASLQAQIIAVLLNLQRELGLGYLFIAHDLALVRYVAHRVAVMYRGHIVEQGDTDTVFRGPLHPYTQLLLALARRERDAVPRLLSDTPTKAVESVDQGTEVRGCPYVSECPFAMEQCHRVAPPLESTHGLSQDHEVACHIAEQKLP